MLRMLTIICLISLFSTGGHAALSDEATKEFFDLVNLDYPGLEEVKTAVTSDDYSTAKQLLADYYETRKKPGWHWDESNPNTLWSYHDNATPDEILARKFTILSKPYQLADPIDWGANPFNDREWAWLLNRHQFFQALGMEYLGTRDEKYAIAFNEILTDWIMNNPVPDKRAGIAHSWRTIEAGIRMLSSWPASWHFFRSSPSFTTDTRILMLKSFAEHADFLYQFPSGGNWNLMENNGLLHVGAVFPEFKEAEKWREAAIDRLVREIEHQVYPDGMQFELTTTYHNVSLWNFLQPVTLRAVADGVDFPQSYYDTLVNMQRFFAGIRRPDGLSPMLNDSDSSNHLARIREQILDMNVENIAEIKPIMQVEPNKESILFPYAGLFAMRTGCEPQDLYLMMDGGPFGAGHQHEDKLNIEVYAYGKPFIVDPGRFTYAAGGGYFRASGAHNLILVDGMGQNRRSTDRSKWIVREPAPGIRWITEFDFDYAEAVYDDGFGSENDTSVIHTRKIFFVKPEYWIVCDILDGEGERKFEQLWHFMPGKIEVLPGIARTISDEANLAIIRPDRAEARIVEGEETPILGYYSWVYNERAPSPTAVFTTEATAPTVLDTVLYPTPAGIEISPLVTNLTCIVDGKRPAPGQLSALSIQLPEYEDIFVICHDEAIANSTKRFLNFEFTGEAVWIRTDKKGTVVKALVLDSGTLSQKGKILEQ